MKQIGKWWFPDEEKHMIPFVEGGGEYQQEHRKNALKHVKEFRVAIDVGAHVGLWSRDLVKKFEHVHAFEPIEKFQACYRKNLASFTNFSLHPVALGHENRSIAMCYEADNTGHSHVDLHTSGGVIMTMLDDFNYPVVDYIKIDAEGFEEFICRGGVETIKRCRPIVSIEQKAHNFYVGEPNYHGQFGAKWFLESIGMKFLGSVSADLVLGWEEIKPIVTEG